MEWKDLIGFEDLYWISSEGKIKNSKGKIVKTYYSTRCEYPMIRLYKEGETRSFMVHRLVAKHFVPNEYNKPQVNHKDKNKSNYSASNLEWVTAVENMHHHYTNGGVKRNNQTYKGKFGKDHNRSIKLECDGVIYHGISEASRVTGIGISTIWIAVKENRPAKGKFFKLV